MIPAMRLVAQKIPDVHLAIVGPDNDHYKEKVKHWCKTQHIENKVSFEDFLDFEATKQAYVDADLFVLPSYTENFGMVVVEAMACGCPVIISNRVNIWREIQQANAGLVVDLDIRKLAEAITRTLTDKEAASEMGLRGRKAAEKKYAWPDIVKQLTGVYEELINRN